MHFDPDKRTSDFVAFIYLVPSFLFLIWVVLLADRLVAPVAPTSASAMVGSAFFVSYVGWIAAGYRLWRVRPVSMREALSRDSRAPVLYLRPFRRDVSLKKRMVQSLLWAGLLNAMRDVFSTEDEETTDALGIAGPVVAIGNEREQLAGQEAARLYVPHDRWQQIVSTILRRATVVVVRIGDTPGVRWELSQAVKTVVPRRLALLIVCRAHDYSAFRQACLPVFPKPLPEPHRIVSSGRVSGVMWFSDDWDPQFSEYRAPWGIGATVRFPCREALRTAFRPVFQGAGVVCQGPKRCLVPTPAMLLTLAAATGALLGASVLAQNYEAVMSVTDYASARPFLRVGFIVIFALLYILYGSFVALIYWTERTRPAFRQAADFTRQLSRVRDKIVGWLAKALGTTGESASPEGSRLLARYIVGYMIGDSLDLMNESGQPLMSSAEFKIRAHEVAGRLISGDRTLREVIVETLRMRLSYDALGFPELDDDSQRQRIGLLLQRYGGDIHEGLTDRQYTRLVDSISA